jgi:hypothetical protein
MRRISTPPQAQPVATQRFQVHFGLAQLAVLAGIDPRTPRRDRVAARQRSFQDSDQVALWVLRNIVDPENWTGK